MASIISNNYYKPTQNNAYTDTGGAYYKPKPIPKPPSRYQKPPVSIKTTSPGSGKPNVLMADSGGQGAWWNAPNEAPTESPFAGFNNWIAAIGNGNPVYTPYVNSRGIVVNQVTPATTTRVPFPSWNPPRFGESISTTMRNNRAPAPLPPTYSVPYLDNGIVRYRDVPSSTYDQSPTPGRTASFAPNILSPWTSNIQQTVSPTYTTAAGNRDARIYADVETAFAKRNRAISQPQDYFTRMFLNNMAYSVPNQMLSFADTGGVNAWDTGTRWFEPPAGYTDPNHMWKESIGAPWGRSEEVDDISYELLGGGYGGGWGGWGGGGYGASSGVNSYLPGTRAGYGANASSPRYTGGYTGRGSSYAGGQYQNQAAWRMPMLVWNI